MATTSAPLRLIINFRNCPALHNSPIEISSTNEGITLNSQVAQLKSAIKMKVSALSPQSPLCTSSASSTTTQSSFISASKPSIFPNRPGARVGTGVSATCDLKSLKRTLSVSSATTTLPSPRVEFLRPPLSQLSRVRCHHSIEPQFWQGFH